MKMITDIQKKFLIDLEKPISINETKNEATERKRNRSIYKRRIRKRIDHQKANLLWLAEHRPDLLADVNEEMIDRTLPRYRRARALLRAVTLFENEPTVLSLIAEIYSERNLQIEVTKKE